MCNGRLSTVQGLFTWEGKASYFQLRPEDCASFEPAYEVSREPHRGVHARGRLILMCKAPRMVQMSHRPIERLCHSTTDGTQSTVRDALHALQRGTQA